MAQREQKVYVDVLTSFDVDGRMRPCTIIWGDGRRFDIDRIIECRAAASSKVGGMGNRYTIQLLGRQRYLYFERFPNMTGIKIGRWYLVVAAQPQDI